MSENKWALFNDYRWRVLPVVKQTEKTTTVLDGTRERRPTNVAAVSNNQDTLIAAAERLTSSDALAADDQFKAALRGRERNAAILASLA